MLTARTKQILVENEGSAEVPGIYTATLATNAEYIGFSNEQGAIRVGVPLGATKNAITALTDSSTHSSVLQVGAGIFANRGFTPSAFAQQSASLSAYRGARGGFNESGKLYLIQAQNVLNWRLESRFKLKDTDYLNYIQKTGGISLEVVEKSGGVTRVVRFELSDDSAQSNRCKATFSVGDDVIWSEDSAEAYISDNPEHMEVMAQYGAFPTKWGNFDGGIHLEKTGNRYSLTITSVDNSELDEVFSIEYEGDSEWLVAGYGIFFGQSANTTRLGDMKCDLIQFKTFGNQAPETFITFINGDVVTVDTSEKKRVLLNGTSFRDCIELGSTFHQFPPGQSLVQILLPAGADVVDIQLEIEEQEI